MTRASHRCTKLRTTRKTIKTGLSDEIERQKESREGYALRLMSLDIDQFKSIKDTYGYPPAMNACNKL